MISNSEIRRLARTWLKGHWGKAIVIALISFALTFVLQTVISLMFGGNIVEILLSKFGLTDTLNSLTAILEGSAINDPSRLQETISIEPYITSIASFLLITPITIGVNFIFYLNAARAANPQISDMFKGYRIYGRTLGVRFIKGLFIGLWVVLYVVAFFISTLVFAIIIGEAGIILALPVLIGGMVHVINKALSYSFAEYFMIENPEYGIMDCIRQSKENMNGKKGGLFGLMMSIYWPVIAAVFSYFILYITLMAVDALFFDIVLSSGERLAITIIFVLLIEAVSIFCNIYFYAAQAHFFLVAACYNKSVPNNCGGQSGYSFYGQNIRPAPSPLNIENDYKQGIRPLPDKKADYHQGIRPLPDDESDYHQK